jgi:hypothetical protein
VNADALELPHIEQPHAWRQDGMRIVVMYWVTTDSILARFDTKIDGSQFTIAYEVGMAELKEHHQAPQEFAKMMAPAAKDAFLKGKAQKGYALWIAQSENWRGR